MIRALTLETLQIPFKVAFRHAAASRDATSSLWVEATTASGARGRGAVSTDVTRETTETACSSAYNAVGREWWTCKPGAWAANHELTSTRIQPPGAIEPHCSTRSPARKN
jgi:hypothetical protein